MSMKRKSTRAEENKMFVILVTHMWMQKVTFIVVYNLTVLYIS